MENIIERKWDIVIVKDKNNWVDLKLPIWDVIEILKKEWRKHWVNIKVNWETVEFEFIDWRHWAEITLDEFLQLSLEVIENWSEVRNIN